APAVGVRRPPQRPGVGEVVLVGGGRAPHLERPGRAVGAGVLHAEVEQGRLGGAELARGAVQVLALEPRQEQLASIDGLHRPPACTPGPDRFRQGPGPPEMGPNLRGVTGPDDPADRTRSAPWAAPADDVVAELGTDVVTGLSREAAARRLAEVGPNVLDEAAPVPRWRKLLAQLRDPLIYLLLGAVVVSLLAWL